MTNPGELTAPCPTCGAELWEHVGGQYVLRQRVIRLRDDGVSLEARCHQCRGIVDLPFLRLQDPPAPEVEAPRARRRVGVRKVVVVDTGQDPT